jgi:hypothetical protein
MKTTIYRARNPPISGGKEFFQVNSQKEAIIKTKKLNEKAKIKDWSWA